MAKFNEILVGRYNRYLQKLLQIKGGAPTAQLSTEVGVQISLFHGVETRYLEGWDTFWASLLVAGVAAVHAGVQLRNGNALNIMIVIERIQYAVGTAGDLVSMSAQAATADFANGFGAFRMDARTGRSASAFLSTNSTVDSADLSSLVWAQTLPTANSPVDHIIGDSDNQVILAPGDALRIRNNTANSSLRVSLRWRERFLEDSERS